MDRIKFSLILEYDVEADIADDIYSKDLAFFESLKDDFGAWPEKDGEYRHPVKFEIEHEKVNEETGSVAP